MTAAPAPEAERAEAAERLALYRRAAAVLGSFYGRFTAPFCAHCLEVTARHHRGDPRADVELREGVFPGCCHAGVGDALWVPRTGEVGRFSPALAAALIRAREGLGPAPREPAAYVVRERQSGLLARGVACLHLGPDGCRLGELKGPLCIGYLCEAVRQALEEAVGAPELLGPDTDDFCGVREALGAAVGGELDDARARVAELEERVATLAARVSSWEERAGTTVWGGYSSSAKGWSPSTLTR